MKNRILLISLALLLAISMVAAGCPPPDPVNDVAPPPPEPEKVWRWYPSTWTGAGIAWDDLVYLSNYITEASGGRIVVTPTLPGAVVPVMEQLDAVAEGITPAMMIYPGYFGGIIPVLELIATTWGLTPNFWDTYQYVMRQRDGRVFELVKEELYRYGDIVVVAPIWRIFDIVLCSRIPIRGIEDIEGLKLRSGDRPIIDTMAELGASVVWFPGPEIYAALAGGVVDAITFANVICSIALGFHEVSNYWIRQPFFPAGTELFIVNGEVWRELPDDLRAIVSSAVKAANVRGILAYKAEAEAAWEYVEAAGVEIIEWTHEDHLKWRAVSAGLLHTLAVDPASTEAVEILEEFLKEWHPEIAELAGLL